MDFASQSSASGSGPGPVHRQLLLLDPNSFANLINSPDERFHRRACLTLANAFSEGLQKLKRQVAHAQYFISESELLGRLDLSLLELYRVIEDGKRFICNCTCSQDDLMLKKAIALGLSTEAVNSHLHDFLVAFCAASDTIGHALEGALTSDQPGDAARLVSEFRRNHEIPDLLWGQELGPHIVNFDGEQLVTQINEDRAFLKHKVDELMKRSSHQKDNNEDDYVRQRLTTCLSDRLGFAKYQETMSDFLTIAPNMFASFKDLVYRDDLHVGNFARLCKVSWLGGEYVLKEYFRAYYVNFRQEAPILVKMQHPNVIQTTCLFEDDKKCGILMEIMDEDLEHFLQEKKSLTLLTKLNIMLQIAKGMEYVHSKRVIHRDLKPKNVLVKRQDGSGSVQVKVTDFNDAKSNLHSSKFTTKQVGTGVFRAPEVMLGEEGHSKYKNSADVYSFAMVCFQVLSGQQPFHDDTGRSLRAVLGKDISGGKRPELGGHCPPYLRHCVETWWQEDPERRPRFTEICRTLRHLIGALVRCPNPLKELPFLSWTENQCQAAQERAKERMRVWEERTGFDYTRVNEIPFEMYMMRMIVEKTPPPRSPPEENPQVPPPPDTNSKSRGVLYWLCCGAVPSLSTHMAFHDPKERMQARIKP